MAGRTIGVVSGKGGVGKTTLVVNLGAALSHKFKKRVCIVDLNLTTSHLGGALGMHYCPANIAKVLKGEAELSDAVFKHEESGMKIVPGSMKLSDLQGIGFYRLKPALKTLANSHDFVLVDAGPGLGLEAMAALKYSEELLYVTTPFVPAVMDLVRCEEAAKQFGHPILGIALNMVDEEEHQLSVHEVERLTGIKVIAIIPRDAAVSKSLASETPLVLQDEHAPASDAVFHLAAKLCGEKYSTPSKGIMHHLKHHMRRAAKRALR